MEIAICEDPEVGGLEHSILTTLEKYVHALADSLPALTRWEQDHLFDHPTAAGLAIHKASLQDKLRSAHWLSMATRQADFPDHNLAELLESIIRGLEFKMELWHTPRTMTPAEADDILKQVFGENCLNES